MSKCPHCHNEIPLNKFLWVNNFSTLKCPHCHSELLPDKKMLSLIGGVSGATLAFTVILAMTTYLLTNKQFGSLIFWFTTVSVILMLIATLLITRNLTDLTLKN